MEADEDFADSVDDQHRSGADQASDSEEDLGDQQTQGKKSKNNRQYVNATRTQFVAQSVGIPSIGLVFQDTRTIPSKPRQDERIYRSLTAASENSTLSSATNPSKGGKHPGHEELNMLLRLCPALNPQSAYEQLSDALKYSVSDRECLTIDNRDGKPKAKKGAQATSEGTTKHNRLDSTVPPLSDIHQIFDHIAQVAVDHDFVGACLPIQESGIRVFTMCSGTESPFIAMALLQQSLALAGHDRKFNFQHLGSAEIEPAKQAFIERNFSPPVIFRDVTEFMAHKDNPENPEYLPLTAYGSPYAPPHGAHILIAGSSCVDYSGLNKDRKTSVEDGEPGESANTLAGVAAYAEVYQPTLIILENVATAPWNDIISFWAGKGYYCMALKLDSLDFYVPQTRQRGYCLGINIKQALSIGFDFNQAGEEWAKLMATFQRRASSPYTDFMLHEDDPRLQLSRNISDNSTTRPPNIAWERCLKRHVMKRDEEGLGSGNPYTKRVGVSKPRMDDYAWQLWATGQSTRVLDVLDIHFLYNVAFRDFDMRFKHRNINVSQNIDRDVDTRQWGIVGCITPSGSLFDTYRGGPLVGLEVFALQGMPIGDLSLGKESSQQLQDLAGNAMTTTVIGAAIISAIIACFRVSDKQKSSSGSGTSIFQHYAQKFAGKGPQESSSPTEVAKNEQDLINRSKNHPLSEAFVKFPRASDKSLREIIVNATDSQPLCRCEGLNRHTKYQLKYCPECFYTCCKKCSRDQHHSPLQDILPEQVRNRRPARNFIRLLTNVLPPVLSLNTQVQIDRRANFINNICDFARERIWKAFESIVRFRGVEFDGSWRARYESPDARLELEFTPKRHVCHSCSISTKSHLHVDVAPTWLLFARCAASEPAASKVRETLQQPIARMQPTQDLLNGNWQLRDDSEESYPLLIVGVGEETKSWEQNLGLQTIPFRNLNVFTGLEVRLDTRSNSKAPEALQKIVGRYTLLQKCPAAGGTLHRQISQSSVDSPPAFLFLNPHPISGAYSDRVVFANQTPRRNLADDRTILAKLPAWWRPVASPHFVNNTPIECALFNQWSPYPCYNLELKVPESQNQIRKWYQPATFPIDPSLDCTRCSSTLLLVDLGLDSGAHEKWRNALAHPIELEDKPDALKEFGWILSHAANISLLEGDLQTFRIVEDSKCKRCSPSSPMLSWVRDVRKDVVQPVEDRDQAKTYELAMKNRPKPAFATIHCLEGRVFLDIQINVKALSHRAVSQLSLDSKSDSHCEVVEWRLVPHNHFAIAPPFGPLQLHSNRSEGMIEDEKLGHRSLWISQREALLWMQRQENFPPTWKEMSLVESRLPALGWRLEAKTFLTKSNVRGGIIADEVGGGKTMTSLALVYFDHEQKGSGTAFPTSYSQERLKSEATLIMMPRNIIKQWTEEVENLLSWKQVNSTSPPATLPYYIVVNKTDELMNFSRQQIQSATIILAPWDIFQEDEYWISIQKIACAPNTPKDPGRAFQEWLNEAFKSLGAGMEKLDQNEEQFWNEWTNIRSRSTSYKRFEPLKTRKTQKVALKAQESSNTATANAIDSSGAESDSASQPPKSVSNKPAPSMRLKTAPRDTAASKKRSRAQSQQATDVAVDSTAIDGNAQSRKSGSDKPVAAKRRKVDSTSASAPKKTSRQNSQESDKTTSSDAVATPQNDDHHKDENFEDELDTFRKDSKIPTLLHMFTFRRLIVDEFTYVNGKTLLALLKLDATSRWLLSGTPPIHDYDGVNTMAKLLGTQISTWDEQDGKFGFGKDRSKMTRDRSNAEEFQSYRGVVSAAYKEGVYEHATKFSDLFIRKNAPSSDRQTKSELKCRFNLTASEMHTYIQVDELASALDRTFNKTATSKKKSDDEWRSPSEKRLITAIEKTPEADAARLCSTSLLHKTLGITTSPGRQGEREILECLIQEQESLLLSNSDKLLVLLRELWGLGKAHRDASSSFAAFQSKVIKQDLSEVEVISIVDRLLWFAKAHPLDPAQMNTDAATKQIATRMAKLSTSIETLAQVLRRLRFSKVVFALFNQSALEPCSFCGSQPNDTDKVSVSSQCGHIIGCQNCHQMEKEGWGCCAALDPERAVAAKKFTLGMEGPLVDTVKGGRMREALSIIKSFSSQDLGLVFIQFEELKDAFLSACTEAGIRDRVVDGWKDTRRAVEGFKSESASGKPTRKGKGKVVLPPYALVLKVDSPDAAGWNLQCANHVVFLSPLLAESEEERVATMTQAVGRSWRPGQTKPVHVYHLVAEATIEPGMVALP